MKKNEKNDIVHSILFDASQCTLKQTETNVLFPKDNAVTVITVDCKNEEDENDISYLCLKKIAPPNEISIKKKLTNQISTTSSNFINSPYRRRSVFPMNENESPKISFKKLRRNNSIRPVKINFFEENPTPRNCKGKLKRFLTAYLDHNIELAVMTVFTLFALFAPDLKTLLLNPKYDDIFNGFWVFVMFVFVMELASSIWVKENYHKSFFFLLDLLASLSMFLEIDWILIPIMNNIIYDLSLSHEKGQNEILFFQYKRGYKISTLMIALRIIRLVRMVKLYKAFAIFVTNLERKKKKIKLIKKKLEKEKNEKKREEARKRRDLERIKLKKETSIRKSNRRSTNNDRKIKDQIKIQMPLPEKENINSSETKVKREKTSETIRAEENQKAFLEFIKQQEFENSIEVNDETNISKAAFNSIIQKVILVILLMLIFSPITDNELYNSEEYFSYLILCRVINNLWAVFGKVDPDFQQMLHSFITNNSDPFFPIMQILYNDTIIWQNDTMRDLEDYRLEEKGYGYTPDGLTQIVYSNQNLTNLSAVINLCRTIFGIMVLSYMVIVLEEDLKKYILNPLEVMINLVDSVAKDPISLKNIESLKNKVKNSINKSKLVNRRSQKNSEKNNNQAFDIEGAEYEVKVIQLAIIKISALLAIGFGEAGGEILRENISSQSELNPMIPGKRKCAIFGFCDIRNFQDINVALQEKTMVFVNEIADIVHSCVDKFSGSINKNIGEAFLTVWKFPHLEMLFDFEESSFDPMMELSNAEPKANSLVADKAVLGYLNIIKNINKNPTILSYEQNAELQAKFLGKFKVEMGFGLHVGWGIEGPIGSYYKIDCSYLSPNVNISARLEALTRHYGVSILVSGELYDLLSPELKNICRLIDIVTVKGSVTPLRIFTIHTNCKLKPGKIKRKEMSMKEKRKHYNMKKEQLKTEYDTNKNGSIGKVVLNKEGFKELIIDKKRPILFYERFREGFKYYVEGCWDKAFKNLKDAHILDPSDGPTQTLLNYIKLNNKKAPHTWKGYRELMSK